MARIAAARAGDSLRDHPNGPQRPARVPIEVIPTFTSIQLANLSLVVKCLQPHDQLPRTWLTHPAPTRRSARSPRVVVIAHVHPDVQEDLGGPGGHVEVQGAFATVRA